MKVRPPLVAVLLALLLGTSLATPVIAEDESIDKLIKKLPPPEKVVKQNQAAIDPLAQQLMVAIKKMNFGNAYVLSQKLAARYPKSADAHSVHGQLALLMKHYPEASNAFQRAISIDHDFAFAYLGLALSEASQEHMSSALSNFRQVTRLYPGGDVGWIGMSACAERLGRRSDCIQYARKATSVAPSSFAAWLQLSRAEEISGNRQAAANALARANELKRKQTKTSRKK